MSLAALALVAGHIAFFGVTHEADEGTAAHLFQILMALQVPVMLYFAVRRLPENTRQGLFVLALQIVAALAPLGVVYWFKL